MLIHLQLAAVLDSFSSAVVLWRFSFNESQKDSNSLERERRFVYIALASCKTSGTSAFHRPQGSTILRTISRALIGPVRGTPNMYAGIWSRLLMKYSYRFYCHIINLIVSRTGDIPWNKFCTGHKARDWSWKKFWNQFFFAFITL